MGAILDLIGSYIFKAAMIGIILATSVSLNEVMVKKAQTTNLEKSMNVSMSVFEWDIRNLGYNYFGSSSVIECDNHKLKFYSDTQNDGVPEEVKWDIDSEYVVVGDSTVKRYNVEREAGGSKYVVFRRLRHWSMVFLDVNGNQTTTPSAVRGIQVRLTAESPFVVNDEILTATRQITLYPANLSL